MKQIIDILFVIGVLINVVKAGEIILRPHQQKRIQEKVEFLALWLDYTKPLVWFVKTGRHRLSYLFHASATLTFTILAFLAGAPWWIKTLFSLYTLLTITVGIILAASEIDDVEDDFDFDLATPLRIWLRNTKTFSQHLFGHLLISGITVLFVILAYRTKGHILGGGGFWISLLNFIIFGLMFGITSTVGISSIIIGSFSLLLLVIEALLTIVRGIVWRIAEYDKGAFPAIVLILTLMLGVAEYYMRFKQSTLQQSSPTPVQTSPSTPGTSPSPSRLP